MNLALQNASGLLTEAEVLLAARRYGRSFAMAALALEEIGKVVFLAIAADPGWADLPEKTLRKFWRQFADHAAKMNFLLGYRWKEVLYVRRKKLPRVRENAKSDSLLRAYNDVFDYLDSMGIDNIEQLKPRCIYVDTDERKRRFEPPAVVPKGVAEAIITPATAISMTLVGSVIPLDGATWKDCPKR